MSTFRQHTNRIQQNIGFGRCCVRFCHEQPFQLYGRENESVDSGNEF